MNKNITVQIASIPSRVESLEKTVNSIIDQCTFMQVCLNGYTEVPMFLRGNRKISAILTSNEMSDGNKAYNVEDKEGYVFFCDDDLIYPKTYCQDMISGIEKYKCIVSLHGKKYPQRFYNFYKIEANYRCLGNVIGDHIVDVVGSGVMAYHTDHFKLKYSDIKSPHMADIWISKAAKEQGVKIMVLSHTSEYLQHTRFNDNLFIQENAKGFAKQTEILKEMFNA